MKGERLGRVVRKVIVAAGVLMGLSCVEGSNTPASDGKSCSIAQVNLLTVSGVAAINDVAFELLFEPHTSGIGREMIGELQSVLDSDGVRETGQLRLVPELSLETVEEKVLKPLRADPRVEAIEYLCEDGSVVLYFHGSSDLRGK